MSSETLAQSAYRQLRDDIVEGRIAPNTILSERELADRLGISRTPLRSALSMLEREQVIERMGNGALLVRRVSVEHLLDIFQLRQILERAAAARAAEFGMTPALEEARVRQMRYLEEGRTNFETFWQDDGDFHQSVAAAARLSLLPGLLAEQRAIVRRSTVIRNDTTFADQALEHVAVIDAIAARDPQAALAAMSRHFDQMRARTLSWLDRN
ncbi:GntR family transcriptional regulator [Neotabrizicola sp. VNH66]|uniref:GntR family transcriptional regulator n=1 Tax=Neotabrizicola sp. VNH66 TaxID=3400918 RepID=UPI003C0BB669